MGPPRSVSLPLPPHFNRHSPPAEGNRGFKQPLTEVGGCFRWTRLLLKDVDVE